jgi:hypothetical protein
MDVVFAIRRADLKKALKELKANRGRAGMADLVYLLVSGYAATFRAPGTESEYPVHGIAPGTARLPIAVLERITEMRTSVELELRVADGEISCGKARVRHTAITLGGIPDMRISVPIDASAFALVVISRVLGNAAVIEQGIGSSIARARQQMDRAISNAASSLAPFGVTEVDIQSLVERAIEKAQEGVRRGLLS